MIRTIIIFGYILLVLLVSGLARAEVKMVTNERLTVPGTLIRN